MAVEEAIAIVCVGLTYIFFWLSGKEQFREKHESISFLFLFLGIMMLFCTFFSAAILARSATFYGIESLFVTWGQVMSWVFIFVLFYFFLQFLIQVLTMLLRVRD